MKRTYVGGMRPNQLIYTFGIGSVIDLPHIGGVVMGLDAWDARRAEEIREPRLLEKVRSLLGPEVQRLSLPPMPEEQRNPYERPDIENLLVGVPVMPFPTWYRCPYCDVLAPISSGLFELKPGFNRADKVRYEHVNCAKGKSPSAVPARFLTACLRGHMQDFPWVAFVHSGRSCGAPRLRLHEFGVSGSASEVTVKCESCNTARRMSHAFDPRAMTDVLHCEGRHAHLGTEEACGEQARTILLGATNSWFPVAVSILNLPEKAGELRQLVDEHWEFLKDVGSLQIVALMRKANALRAFSAYSDEILLETIQEKLKEPEAARDADVKRPEWKAFANPAAAIQSREFTLHAVPVPEAYAGVFAEVVLASRLREVRALIGFTRIDSPGDFGAPENIPPAQRVALARQTPESVPAAEVRGEGIFVRFREDALRAWLARPDVCERGKAFAAAHRSWKEKRHLPDPDQGFPGMRFVLLHTFAHAAMRRIALECGYSAAGIRERIYSAEATDESGPMAGVLLYTAAPDSEGTLGGLVHLGKASNLERILSYAFEDMSMCSSDPLCSRHDPPPDGAALHGAACHACLFSPETSCEAGNRFLDRALLVPVFARDRYAFFHTVASDPS